MAMGILKALLSPRQRLQQVLRTCTPRAMERIRRFPVLRPPFRPLRVLLLRLPRLQTIHGLSRQEAQHRPWEELSLLFLARFESSSNPFASYNKSVFEAPSSTAPKKRVTKCSSFLFISLIFSRHRPGTSQRPRFRPALPLIPILLLQALRFSAFLHLGNAQQLGSSHCALRWQSGPQNAGQPLQNSPI